MNRVKVLFTILALFFITPSFSATASAESDDNPGPAALFEAKCSICHSVERAKKKRKSERGWKDTVMRMKNNNGAPITGEEAEIIIKHLSDHYGK